MLLLILFVIGFFGARSYKAGHTPVQTSTEQDPAITTVGTVSPTEAQTHIIGNISAPYTLIYFFDYDCPHCKEAFASLATQVAPYKNLRVIVRQFPLSSIHPTAFKKAVLAECLVTKGYDFFALSTHMFNKQTVSASTLKAADLGVKNQTDISTCLDNEEAQARVLASQRGGMNVGLYTTPSVFLFKGGVPVAQMNYATPLSLDKLLRSYVQKD